jgi:hypothetical protein
VFSVVNLGAKWVQNCGQVGANRGMPGE